MKLNYDKFKELNIEALTADGTNQLACFYVVQMGVERYLNGDTITEECKDFLINIGVLEVTEERKQIVEPFNFMGNGTQSS
jgi:hypothetical protein